MVKSAGIRKLPSALQQAGVENRRFRMETLSLEEIVGTSYVRVHSLAENPFSAATTFCLPHETGQCSDQDPQALCLRPREWLLTSHSLNPETLLHQITVKTDPSESAILNLSDSFATFRLSGNAAPWLLNKVSGLDFLAGRARGAHCAQTKMGHTAVIVHYHQVADDAFAFDLILDRSIGKHLWSLLIESADHAEELAKNHGDAI